MNIGTASAQTIDAGFVMNKMNVNQQVSYIGGVVEGLAVSRYLRDRPSLTGMNCIYKWYGNNTGTKQKRRKMESWLTQNPSKPVGVLLYILIKRDCGA